MNEIAFFPWFKIDEPVQIGDFELLVYKSQGSLTIQEDLDNIIGEFYPFEKRKVGECVVIKLKGKELGNVFSDEESRKIFMFSELLTFSGLSARAFFWGSMGGYSNKDVYQIVLRKYESTSGGYKITNRRRDGYTETIVGKGATKIRKPKHIQSFLRFPINFDLLDALQMLIRHRFR